MLDLNGYTLSTAEALTIRGTGIANYGALINSSGTDVSYSGAITQGAASRINADAGNIILSDGGISGAYALTVGGASNITISGIISTVTSLTKDGTGTLTLSGNNSCTGTITISVGVVKLGAAGSGANSPLGTVAGITTITAGAVLDLNGFTLVTAEPLTLRGTGINLGGALTNTSATNVSYSGLITLAAASSIITNNGDIGLTNTGNITGATFGLTLGGSGNGSLASNLNTTTGTLAKIGSGIWTVSGSSSFTGATTINMGTLRLGATGTSPNSPLGTTGTGTTVMSGAVLDLNGYTLAIAEGLTLNGRGIDNGGALINNSSSATGYSQSPW